VPGLDQKHNLGRGKRLEKRDRGEKNIKLQKSTEKGGRRIYLSGRGGRATRTASVHLTLPIGRAFRGGVGVTRKTTCGEDNSG